MKEENIEKKKEAYFIITNAINDSDKVKEAIIQNKEIIDNMIEEIGKANDPRLHYEVILLACNIIHYRFEGITQYLVDNDILQRFK